MKNYMVHCNLLIVIQYSERCDTFLDVVKKSDAVYKVGIIECETKKDFSHRYLELANISLAAYKHEFICFPSLVTTIKV